MKNQIEFTDIEPLQTLDSALTIAIDQFNKGTFVPSPIIDSLFKQLAVQFEISAYWLHKVWVNWSIATGIEGIVRVPLSNIS